MKKTASILVAIMIAVPFWSATSHAENAQTRARIALCGKFSVTSDYVSVNTRHGSGWYLVQVPRTQVGDRECGAAAGGLNYSLSGEPLCRFYCNPAWLK